MIITVSDIPITVYKKNIKNMHLSVRPPDGAVTISAPFSIKDATIVLFVRTKLPWIKRQIAQFKTQERVNMYRERRSMFGVNGIILKYVPAVKTHLSLQVPKLF